MHELAEHQEDSEGHMYHGAVARFARLPASQNTRMRQPSGCRVDCLDAETQRQ